jgi:ribosomal protein S18 acetylase RimI-like enzyme
MEKDIPPALLDLENVVIRKLEYHDLPGLEWGGEFSHFRAIYAQTFERATQGLAVPWVAEIACFGLIGQVFIQLDCDCPELADGLIRAYLFSFRIKPTFQGMGLGSRMLDIVHNDLILRGFKTITLNVAKTNFRAIAFYQRRGYTITSHETGTWSYQDVSGEWHQVVEPAWRMEKFFKS